jgi:hypothetical protein
VHLHLFLELATLGCFLAAAVHAVRLRGRDGAGLFAALLWLGFVRENYVLLQELLYGFAPLALQLGRAPLLAAIIWPFSIDLALIWTEIATGETRLARPLPRAAVLTAGLAVLGIAHARGLQALKDLLGW